MLSSKSLTPSFIILGFLALWLHLFNVLFIMNGGLSPIILQFLVLISFPVVLFYLNTNIKVNSVSSEIIYFMVSFSTFVIASVIFIQSDGVLVRVLNFIYLNLLAYFFLSSTDDGFKRLMKCYAFIGIPVLFYILFGVKDLEYRTELDVSPNYIGLVVLSIALASIYNGNKFFKILIFLLCFTVSIVVSSRATMLCLIVIIILDAFWLNKYGFLNLKSSLFKLIYFMLLSVFLSIALFDYMLDIFEVNNQYRGLDSGMSGRDIRWMLAFEAWTERPILGIGFGESTSYLGFTADNAYLTILVELGMVGMFFYLALNLRALYKSYKKGLKSSILFILIYLLYGLFEKRYFSIGNALSIIYIFVLYNVFVEKRLVK